MSTRKSLRTGPVTWSYLDSGSGDETWLTFHGYGQNAEVMHQFMKTFRPNARVLSFDLPLHGETEVKKGKQLRVGDLGEIAGLALRETEHTQCSILGFSLGGKVVLKIMELDPAKIDQVLLIAPDGLKVNPLYWFATNTWLGRSAFQLVIHLPQPILWASTALSFIRLMNPKVNEFVQAQMGSRSKRQSVFDTWIMFREIRPDLDRVSKQVWRYKIGLTLVFGKKDRVIHPRLASKLSGKNCTTAKVVLLNAGHNLITKRQASELKELME